MQWFRHPNSFRKEPILRLIEKKLGEAGYARALTLFEVVAEQGSQAGKFVPKLDLNATCTSIEIDWEEFNQEVGPHLGAGVQR
jgi:hypothetical protein